jgi:SPP1 family predicted phage head-tail adaptor
MIEEFVEYFEPLTISRLTATLGTFGNTIMAWNDLEDTEGYIRTLNGGERVSADKVTVYSTHRLYFFITDIKEKDRISYNSHLYDVKLIDNKREFYQVDLELIE